MAFTLWRRGVHKCVQTACLTSRCFSKTLPNKDPGKDPQNLLTMKQVNKKLMNCIPCGLEFGKEPKIDKNVVMQPVAKSQDELPKRKPSDSFVRAYIPLSDPVEREKYLLFNGGVRFGRILEEFDIFASYLCYLHNRDPKLGDDQKSPCAFVTILVERIEQMTSDLELSAMKDIYLTGNVTWVGSSSLECIMHLNQEAAGKMHHFLSAKFLFASRNPVTNKACFVNPLDPQTQEEKIAFQEGEKSVLRRKEMNKTSLLKAPPTEEEREIIHNFFLHSVDPVSGVFETAASKERHPKQFHVWMIDTQLKSVVICHPEKKNIHHKMFGGFLMMKAYELAWANVSIFTKSRPGMCKTVDEVVFKKPVEIGSILFFTSMIVYTNGPDVLVRVTAQVLNLLEDTKEMTDDFYFTFNTALPNVDIVVPETYAGSMIYLAGKRRYEGRR